MLVVPATVIYGTASLLGLPAIFVFGPMGVVTEPGVTVLYLLIVVLMATAVIGLVSLWVAIFDGLQSWKRWVAGGLVVGLIGAGGFVLMVFSNDGFDMARTWTFNRSMLWPLLLAIAVGVERLVAVLRAG